MTNIRGWFLSQVSPIFLLLALFFGSVPIGTANAAQLLAGVAKVDITNMEAGPVNDRLYVKALVIQDDKATVAIVTVDAVAIAEIGSIRNEYLGKVRSRIEKELNIRPANVLINASHCHGIVCSDIELRTFQAVKEASQQLVRIGLGIKQKSPYELTFVAGYTNGYIYYAPTADQLLNVGGAQEDSDCILAPEWQKLYETKAAEMLQRLGA